MTTKTEVKIHEFSTGIRPEKTADGGWVSLGFTGQYMNATIDPIPYAVQRSIANKEFAVAEGASSNEPAIIGRVVSGGEESDWSVVAIVTRGRDEKGRSASLYRYFLSEGADSLSNIVAWIEDQQQYGLMPVFDPFECKEVGQPSISKVSAPSFKPLAPEIESWLSSGSAPIILHPEQYPVHIINKLATERAPTNGQPVAWAFMVEALEQPGRFQIIHAASDRAYELLQRTIVSIPQVTAPVIDEQAIKSAIKGLISSSRVKPEYVQASGEALGNNQITEHYWKELFDGQGAVNALKQGIYSPQMVRLLTLRAVVIPKTLPDYLSWLEHGNKQNDPYTVFAEFQSQLRNSLSRIPDTAPNLEAKITEGVKVILLKLLEQEISIEVVFRLLKSPNGLWEKFHCQVIQDIDHNLQPMSKLSRVEQNTPFKLTDNHWQSIWRNLQIHWRQPSSLRQEKYQSFAKLFAQLGYPKISAFFYYVGYGKVPKEIFLQLGETGWHSRVYGLEVEREATKPELLWLIIIKLGSKIVPVYIVSILSGFFLMTGLLIGNFVPIKFIDLISSDSDKVGSPPHVSSPTNSPNSEPSNLISQENEITAIEKFPKTTEEINRIFTKLQPKVAIKQKIQDILKIRTINTSEHSSLIKIPISANEKKNWINDIYAYQNSKRITNESGYIEKNSKTSKDLEADVKNN